MCTNRQTAVIVIDTGFSEEAIRAAGRVIGIYDLRTGFKCVGSPNVSAEALSSFEGDPSDHGSVVLKRLAAMLPGKPFILVRAFNKDDGCVRTEWSNGAIIRDGWTEAYRWAVGLAKERRMNSVANCSFGAATHAVDGTGWEAFQLGQETGTGHPGHIVVAAAGAGDGKALHAFVSVMAGEFRTVSAAQSKTTIYNLWGPPDVFLSDWTLEVTIDGSNWWQMPGRMVPANIWNRRQQFTFQVQGAGTVRMLLTRGPASSANGFGPKHFDLWVTRGESAFLDHCDEALVMEPAVFPHVIAVGLKQKRYAAAQFCPGAKPDVLLPGEGPVSFRTAEVTAAVASLLNRDGGQWDVYAVRTLLGKYPDINALLQ